MKYSEKKQGKALTLGQLRALVRKLDGVPDNAVVRHGSLRAKEISVDENELLNHDGTFFRPGGVIEGE